MNFIKIFLSATLLLMAFTFSGCQGNNSENIVVDVNSTTGGVIPVVPDVNSTKVTVILPVSSAILTTNSQVVNIDVRVFDSANNPYSIGTVTKINPSDVLLGRDIGSFDKDTSTLVNGVASFVYTAPASLDANTSNLSFAFYHDSNSTDTKIYTMSIVPETNQTVLTNYSLQTTSIDGVSMNLESIETVSYSVYDANNNLVVDSNMKSITATSLNPSLGTLTDSFGNSGTSLSLLNKNSMSININSNTISGIIPIKVEAQFVDVNGNDQNITEVFSILVLSGPASAISLSYASTTNVPERAKFVEKWVVTVTDKYSNLVNSNPSVSMGMITGYAQSSAATANAANYLHFPPGATTGASVSAANDNITAQTAVFGNVDDQNDILVIYGTGYKYDVSGKWDILNNSATVLDLIDDYNSTDRVEMGFAVGNNQREDTCDTGAKWVANVYSDSNTSIIDSTGTMVINIEYDYYLTGKSTMLWVNLVGIQNSTNEQIRIGEARKITLRGEGLESDIYSISKDYNGVISLPVKITNTVERYKNGNFNYAVKVSDTITVNNIVTTSMNDIYDCNLTTTEASGAVINHDGTAYVDVNITNDGSATGTIQLVNILLSNEF